jgi:hypothetical protein
MTEQREDFGVALYYPYKRFIKSSSILLQAILRWFLRHFSIVRLPPFLMVFNNLQVTGRSHGLYHQ